MDRLIERVLLANPKRKAKNLDRRIMKLGEEYGETVQAFLAITSKNNLKKKSWDDVREELVDCLILNLDILLTEMPDQKNTSVEDRIGIIYSELDRKLSKWADKMDTRQTEVDDSE
jgi:NTP pyrophosphatase (non-canonical NTP hydrolase)